MTVLEQLRSAGLEVFVKDGDLFLSPAPLVTDVLLALATDNREQVLSDLAAEEAIANGKARSRQSS